MSVKNYKLPIKKILRYAERDHMSRHRQVNTRSFIVYSDNESKKYLLLYEFIYAAQKYRFPVSIVRHAIWLYHRFNHSYRDVQEQLSYRGIIVSHETIRNWSMKCASRFSGAIAKC